MERCGNCRTLIAFGAVKNANGVFCSADCEKGYLAARQGFCEACLAQTTDDAPGNMRLINGIGTMWGLFEKDKCPTCGSAVKTKWFSFLFPLIPLDKYRVLYIHQKQTLTGSEGRFLARKLKSQAALRPAPLNAEGAPLPTPPATPAPEPPPSASAMVAPAQANVPSPGCTPDTAGGRPTAVTVIAVLSIVVAVVGLLLAAVSLVVTLVWLGQSGAQAGALTGRPAHLAFQLFTGAVDIVLLVALLAGAVGILRLRRWARTTLLVRAVVQMAFTAVQSAVVAMMVRGAGAQAGGVVVGAYVGLVAMTLLVLAFNTVLLVVLTRPGVKRAFEGADGERRSAVPVRCTLVGGGPY